MLPVLCATSTPSGTPEGIASWNFCRFRIATISASALRLTASPFASFSISTASAAAVVVLFSPLSKAFWSSTPRSTTMPLAPSRSTVVRTFAAPTRSISRFAAKLLLTVIITSHNWRSVIVLPTAL